jgi:hypothetical protein
MDIFDKLEFTQKWIDLGIISPEKLRGLEAEWHKGEDTNTEHYRWQVFKEYLASKEKFEAETLKELYKLGENDSDKMMGGAMMVEILHRKDCPLVLLENASASNERFLRKVACRKSGKEIVP